MSQWIALNDYANKHRLSISTLRRRIKSHKIEFKLDDGKYFIMDGETVIPQEINGNQPQNSRTPVMSTEALSTTKLLLDELKRAYLDSLQGKEDQILYLKQQVSDLKTLVLLLEKENHRLQGGE